VLLGGLIVHLRRIWGMLTDTNAERRCANIEYSMTEFGVLEERVISDKERKGDV